MYTNINILDNINSYKYIIEYKEKNVNDISHTLKFKRINKGGIEVLAEDTNISREGNIWKNIDESEYSELESITPKSYRESTLRLYIPNFSANIYNISTKYVLDACIWLHGHKIVLGSYLCNVLDCLACAPKHLMGDDYCNYLEFDLINPYSLIYDSEWAQFRDMLLGGAQHRNSNGAVLYFSLYPVQSVGGNYIIADRMTGGQNSINITESVDSYLNIKLTHNLNEPLDNEGFKFICSLHYNEHYNSFNEYFESTYGIKDASFEYELVIKDLENIYIQKSINPTISNEHICEFNISKIKHDLNSKKIEGGEPIRILTDWGSFNNGLVAECYLSIFDKGGNEILYIKSNTVPITQELYSYLLNDSELKNIDLNNQNLKDMELYNIQVVNKNINKVIKINNPINSKNNITKPIFVKSQSLGDININTRFTENIIINLDQYKTYVDSFMIQIEGINFKEIGRNSNGVIFKIIGTSLPVEQLSGTYYILNQDSELICSGKYTYLV